MADVFISYSRADEARAAAVAAAMDQDGRSTWWDRQLASGADYTSVIEREIDAAASVVVGWSAAARDSLWVRAEANEALDQGKLVQVRFDQAKLPRPFAMLHLLEFEDWSGAREQAPWPQLRARVDEALDRNAAAEAGSRRSVPIFAGPEPALQGFGRVAVLGWAALVTAALLALSVLAVARRLVSADAFGVIAVAGTVLSVGLLGACAYHLMRVVRGSRR
jgi:hypothetical protein